jgi:hypothetical protein
LFQSPLDGLLTARELTSRQCADGRMLVSMSSTDDGLRVIELPFVLEKVLSTRTKAVLIKEALAAERIRLRDGLEHSRRVGEVGQGHADRLSIEIRGSRRLPVGRS